MARRKTPVPIPGLNAEQRAVLAEALDSYAIAQRYAAELATKATTDGRARRKILFRAALVADDLADRVVLSD